MGSGHSHSHSHVHGAGAGGSGAARGGERHARALAIALGIGLVVLVAEVVAGLWTGSLALLSDAGHVLTDVVGLAMALAAIRLASRGSRRSDRTFGLYRLEILAALANTALLFGVAGWVLVEAVSRLDDPPEVDTVPMLVVAVLGLAANLGAWFLLREGAAENLNVRGASLEVLADAVGSAGVLVAGVVTLVTGWHGADPVVAAAIGLWILPRALALGRSALRVLVQAAPAHLDLDALRADLASIAGVVDVHDLHVWTLTSDMEVATAHVMVAAGTDTHGVLDQARHRLAEHHGIHHATLQVEPDDHEGCDRLDW